MSYEPVEKDDIVCLNWKDTGKRRNEILSMIHEVICKLDTSGEINVQLSETSAKNTIELRTFKGHVMEVRLRKYVVKRLNSSPQTDIFIARFIRIGMLLAVTIGRQQPWKCRGIQYSAKGTELDADTVKQLVLTWAVTLEVHPYRFGLMFEEKGKVFIPKGYNLSIWHTVNIFKDKNEERKKIVLCGLQPIPQLIQHMWLVKEDKSKDKKLQAVIVTEHRSLDMACEEIGAQTEGVIIVMLGGFPTMAAREFLKMLSTISTIRSVPFIWVSDHDPGAWTMYKTIKHGSTNQAYLSPSLCVKKLEWGGITRAQYASVVEKAKEDKLRELARHNRGWSHDKVKHEADEWAKQRINELDKSCNRAISKEQSQRLRYLQKFTGLNPELRSEIEEMVTTKKGIFSAALFASARTAGLELLMVDVVKQKYRTSNVLNDFEEITSLAIPNNSDDTREWNQLASQDFEANRLANLIKDADAELQEMI